MKLEYLLPIVVIPALWLALLKIYGLLAEDRILRTLHRDYRDIWEGLGRPNGWQWSPPGRIAVPWRMWSFPRAWQHTDPDWLGRTPELRDDIQEIRALRRKTLWPALPVFGVGVSIFALAAYFTQHQ